MAIVVTKQYSISCDLCGAKHPFTFSFEPDEDELNDAHGELGFELDGYWELHTHTALQVPNCYCGKHGTKRGVWCSDCSRKFWEKENAELQRFQYENVVNF